MIGLAPYRIAARLVAGRTLARASARAALPKPTFPLSCWKPTRALSSTKLTREAGKTPFDRIDGQRTENGVKWAENGVKRAENGVKRAENSAETTENGLKQAETSAELIENAKSTKPSAQTFTESAHTAAELTNAKSTETSAQTPLPKLTENLWTVPNILTMSRIATTPFIGYFIVNGNSMMAISIFIYSCITDFLDGFIARRYNLKSVVGSIIDPMADKFLMTVCTVALSVQNIMPPYIAALIIGRDVMLSVMGMWVRYKSLPQPKTFARFADVRIPTVSVHPNLLGKVNTGLQMVYIGGLVLKPGLELILGDYVGSLDEVFSVFGGIVATTTFLSGLSYVFTNNAFKYIR